MKQFFKTYFQSGFRLTTLKGIAWLVIAPACIAFVLAFHHRIKQGVVAQKIQDTYQKLTSADDPPTKNNKKSSIYKY